MKHKETKRIAIQYCGGCESICDRVAYFRKIMAHGRGRIKWVSLDKPPFDAVLLIDGSTEGFQNLIDHLLI